MEQNNTRASTTALTNLLGDLKCGFFLKEVVESSFETSGKKPKPPLFNNPKLKENITAVVHCSGWLREEAHPGQLAEGPTLQGGRAGQHFQHTKPHMLLTPKLQEADSRILQLGTTFHKAHGPTEFRGKCAELKTSASSEAAGVLPADCLGVFLILIAFFLWQKGYSHVEMRQRLILLKGDPKESGKVLHVHRGLEEQSFISKERQL